MPRHRHRAGPRTTIEDLGSSNGNAVLRRERCACGAWRTLDLGPHGNSKPDRTPWETEPEPTGRDCTSPALRDALDQIGKGLHNA